MRRALGFVAERLPPDWQLAIDEEVRVGDLRVDATAEVKAPDGTRMLLLIEAKRQLATRDVANALEQLELYRERLDQRLEVVPMLVARYLPASTRARLEQRGVAYADATGNLRLALERPSLFLRDVGASRDPWRGPATGAISTSESSASLECGALSAFGNKAL